MVVDDGSTDGSIDELKRRFADVQVFSFPERRGCPAAKHQSALLSKGDVLIFLDAHCKPEGRTLIRMVEDVERWDGQAIIAPRIVKLDANRLEARTGFGLYRVPLRARVVPWRVGQAAGPAPLRRSRQADLL